MVFHDGILHVANLGDSRAVVVRGSDCIALTHDHNVQSEQECERVRRDGGEIVRMGAIDRVQGALSVTRAFGHPEYAPYIAVTPDVTSVRVAADDRLLVLASDGLWAVVGNDEILSITEGHTTPQDMANALALEALNRASTDNVTVLVVDLAQYRLPTPP